MPSIFSLSSSFEQMGKSKSPRGNMGSETKLVACMNICLNALATDKLLWYNDVTRMKTFKTTFPLIQTGLKPREKNVRKRDQFQTGLNTISDQSKFVFRQV